MEIHLENLDRKLAGLLKFYPAIWDRKSAAFKNQTLKKNSIKTLAAQLNVSVQVCEERYKSLREKFRKEKLKDQSEGSVEASQRWDLYDQLSFLNDFILQRRKRVSAVKLEDYEEFEEGPVEFTPSLDLVVPKMELETPSSPITSHDSSSAPVPSPSPMYYESGTKSPAFETTQKSRIEETENPPCKKQKLDNQSDLSSMVNQLTQAAFKLVNLEPPKPTATRFEYLGKFITETLNSMREADAEETAKEIMDLLFKKKIDSIK